MLSAIRVHRRRIAQIGTGFALYGTSNWFFDHILYVYVVYRLGIVMGGLIMTCVSCVICAAMLYVYERMKIDWVGGGTIARIAALPNPSWSQRLVRWAVNHGSVAMFIVLNIFQDPFITTAYFRQGRFDGLQKRDWQVFAASVVFSNAYWTLRAGLLSAVIVETLRRL